MNTAITPVRFARLSLFVAGVLLTGFLIGTVTNPKFAYASFVKPFFAPPAWLFGPVWSVLYIMIGIAGWRLYERAPASAEMKLWWAQLALNFLWAPVFFTAGGRAPALAIILALLALILVLVVRLYSSDRTASILLIPYALWVSFATLLNAEIVRLN